jgi:DeoR/GlpR family transcriptional regulator of sugar metabolism
MLSEPHGRLCELPHRQAQSSDEHGAQCAPFQVLQQHDGFAVGDLAAGDHRERLVVAEDTIRRDLREMARDGLLQRVHGGALPASPAGASLAARSTIATDDKQAIGQAAARLVLSGQVVFVDGGTTAVQLVRALEPALRATIVTHSPVIAAELLPFENIDVIMLGGRLMRHSMVAVGAATVEAIGRLHADLYFMGVFSLHPEAGLSTGFFRGSRRQARTVPGGR